MFAKGITTSGGEPVYDYEHIEMLRDKDRKKPNPLVLFTQRGCQEKFLASPADITFFGGNRGGGKSFALLMETLNDVTDRNFNAIVLRNEINDLVGLVTASYSLFGQYGSYNRSKDDMTWNFHKGGSLKFSHYSDSIEDFKKRFQGKQYAYIGIDEITHCPYDKFKYLITCNRNAFGIRNRFYGTCNPDPDSWVVRMIAYWIDEEGDPIPERDGVVRYCFMDGDTVDTIYWGDSPEEVYEQAKSIIDPLWKVEYEELGFDKKSMFIKSVTFIKGKLEENIKLIASDPAYVANLAQQGEEQRARDLAGNWKFRAAGDDLIKMGDMEALFNNEQQIGNGMRTASCDLAFEGGDSCVLWFWIGNHIEDIFVCKLDAKKTQMAIENKLREWGVLEENFTYDLNGLGQYFKGYFPVAKPFNNLAACKDKDKPMYANIKSQCAYLLWRAILAKEISINPRLLERKFSGKGFKNLPLRTILMKERKCIRKKADSEDKGFTLISKDVMKKYVGHSPDYFESLLMKFIFHIKPPRQKPRGLGLL